jgi:hypothetical protein
MPVLHFLEPMRIGKFSFERRSAIRLPVLPVPPKIKMLLLMISFFDLK